MNLTDIAIFVGAVDAGSLAEAARRAGIPPLMASRRLAALEDEIGARLLNRTTRALALTTQGETFLPHARALLDTETAGRASVGGQQDQASGLLRLTASVAFGRKIVTPLLVRFMERHPALQVDLMLTDSIVDIVGQGFDLALRIALLRDNSLVARRLSDNPRRLYAAPAYLRRAGKPKTPADLARHQCLALGDTSHWVFIQDGKNRTGRKTLRQKIGGRLKLNSIDAIHQACLDGAGIALLAEWDAREDVASGKLSPLALAGHVPEPLGIWAVYPSARLLPHKVRLFVDYLQREIRR
ncbi:LysR family transcriptional regulator [Ferrovibrio sp.]|uniref:LysR family transcriptional regulator n=1 Tax=Ferrovibrio sp. TaxID=1917215 RepID=UPI0025C06844|nr:LysR family transcriptional regulator [Ferrovibrio sp.]MBX3456310.1 LysR family transcriptional regulator [Ferrovibrio sp.]